MIIKTYPSNITHLFILSNPCYTVIKQKIGIGNERSKKVDCICAGSGFCLLYKRIERGKFHFPKRFDTDKYIVTNEELKWLLNGLRVEEIRKYEKLKRA